MLVQRGPHSAPFSELSDLQFQRTTDARRRLIAEISATSFIAKPARSGPRGAHNASAAMPATSDEGDRFNGRKRHTAHPRNSRSICRRCPALLQQGHQQITQGGDLAHLRFRSPTAPTPSPARRSRRKPQPRDLTFASWCRPQHASGGPDRTWDSRCALCSPALQRLCSNDETKTTAGVVRCSGR